MGAPKVPTDQLSHAIAWETLRLHYFCLTPRWSKARVELSSVPPAAQVGSDALMASCTLSVNGHRIFGLP